MFELLRNMGCEGTVVAGAVLLATDIPSSTSDAPPGAPRYMSLPDCLVHRAKWWWNLMMPLRGESLPSGTWVFERGIADIRYGMVLRRGYDLYSQQYRVQYFDGSDQWADLSQCRAVSMAPS